VFTPLGTDWSTITTADGLADNHVTQIVSANDGSLWFVTKGGISHYQP
jgi:ligand-binding sensor domain-containing protein